MLVAAAVTIVYAMLPSTTRSSTPVTVTVWATFQLTVVKVTLAGATVPSVRSLLVSPTVTFAVGWVSRTTVNVAVPPASVVTRPEVGATVIPGTFAARTTPLNSEVSPASVAAAVIRVPTETPPGSGTVNENLLVVSVPCVRPFTGPGPYVPVPASPSDPPPSAAVNR